jgi:hypothetical protein
MEHDNMTGEKASPQRIKKDRAPPGNRQDGEARINNEEDRINNEDEHQAIPPLATDGPELLRDTHT